MAWWVWALRFLGLGWYVAFCIVLGTIVGLWLDRKFHTSPILALVGIVLGTIAAFYGLYRMVAPLMEQYGRKDKGEK